MSETSRIPEELSKLCQVQGIDEDIIDEVMATPSQPGEPYIVRMTSQPDLPYAVIDEEEGEVPQPTYQDALNYSLALALDTKLMAAVAYSHVQNPDGSSEDRADYGPAVKLRGDLDEVLVFKVPTEYLADQQWADLIRSRLPGALVVGLGASKMFDQKVKQFYDLMPLGDAGQRPVTLSPPLGYLGRFKDFVFVSAPTPKKKASWQRVLHAQLVAASQDGQIRDGEVTPVVLDAKVQICRLVKA